MRWYPFVATGSVVVLGTLLLTASALAATIEVHVEHDGKPVVHAVAYATRTDNESLSRPSSPTAEMDQRDEEFVPHVLPVQKGTVVHFPNSDETRHHVYSFSEARTFELRLYEGTNAPPVTFEQTGVVTIGCNIHDWMLGYILVLDTPAFARTDDKGGARLEDLPAGRYRVELWHPRVSNGREIESRTVQVAAEARTELVYELALDSPRTDRGRGFQDDRDSLEEAFGR
ncbi:MAG: methylamine utilization protein [Halofilum sp. (in: g-proteobacteria)]